MLIMLVAELERLLLTAQDDERRSMLSKALESLDEPIIISPFDNVNEIYVSILITYTRLHFRIPNADLRFWIRYQK